MIYETFIELTVQVYLEEGGNQYDFRSGFVN